MRGRPLKKFLLSLVLLSLVSPAHAQPSANQKSGQDKAQNQRGQRDQDNQADQEDQDHGRPVGKIAKELGVTPEKFREAFKKVHPAGPGEHPTHEQRVANRKVLSEALGVSPERLDAVMDKYRPGGRGDNGPPDSQNGRPPRPEQGPEKSAGGQPPDGDHGRPMAKMAQELGVSADQLRAAFSKTTHPAPGQRPTPEQRKANRKILSDALHVAPEKLDKVMDKYRPKHPPGEGPDGPNDRPGGGSNPGPPGQPPNDGPDARSGG
jgi:hypothetical protein